MAFVCCDNGRGAVLDVGCSWAEPANQVMSGGDGHVGGMVTGVRRSMVVVRQVISHSCGGECWPG